MGIFSDWQKRRQERERYIRKQIDKRVDNIIDSSKQKANNRKEIIKSVIENRPSGCPMLGGQNKLLELESDPEKHEPFGWPKGTVRGMITIWFVLGFTIITMLMIFAIPFTVGMILEIWKILAAVFALIIGSYFYTRLKTGSGGLLGGGLFV